MTRNRYQAFAIHLGLSCLVALSVATVVFLVWYPGPFAQASGVTSIFLMMLVVDVAIGPIITLCVFNPKKKELRRDLTIVALLQTCALAYGVYTVFVPRPVYAVYNVDRFDLVFANDLTPDKLKAAPAGFKTIPLWSPQVIGALPSKDRQVRQRIMFNAAAGGDDLPQMPEFYVPYERVKEIAAGRIQPIERLKESNPGQQDAIDALVRKYGAQDQIGFLPVRGKVQDVAAIVEKGSAKVLEFVRFKPWRD